MAKVRVAKAAECLPVNGIGVTGEMLLEGMLLLIRHATSFHLQDEATKMGWMRELVNLEVRIESILNDTWEQGQQPAEGPAGE